MQQKHKNIIASLSSQILISLALASIVGIRMAPKGSLRPGAFLEGSVGSYSAVARTVHGQDVTPDTPLFRQAKRLQKRLRHLSYLTPSVKTLADALQERKILLGRSLSVTLSAPDGNVFPAWEVSLNRYPTWLQGTFTASSARFEVSKERIDAYLRENGIDGVKRATTSVITDLVPDDRGVLRVTSEHPAEPGYEFDTENLAETLSQALKTAEPTHSVALKRAPGHIVNETGQDLGSLTLIAEGRSNFAGSISGRVANVKKGLKERMNNILVPPGATFSFNKALGSVTSQNGWYEALGIFNGEDLRPITGGGICQVATTVYRATLLAGLPVMDRKAHSLFVHYYEKYAVGIDATVYPGHQDLTFVNDTGNYLLLQAYYDGFEATVNMYGTPDGRMVHMEGPYFAKNAPADFLVNDRGLYKNEIAWVQHVTLPGGVTKTNTIVSRYKSIPKTVVATYAEDIVAEGQENVGHASAPDELTMMRNTF